MPITCFACGEEPTSKGRHRIKRGLCVRCYERHKKAGTLEQAAKPNAHKDRALRNRSIAEVEWPFFRDWYLDDTRAKEHLAKAYDMTLPTLQRILREEVHGDVPRQYAA